MGITFYILVHMSTYLHQMGQILIIIPFQIPNKFYRVFSTSAESLIEANDTLYRFRNIFYFHSEKLCKLFTQIAKEKVIDCVLSALMPIQQYNIQCIFKKIFKEINGWKLLYLYWDKRGKCECNCRTLEAEMALKIKELFLNNLLLFCTIRRAFYLKFYVDILLLQYYTIMTLGDSVTVNVNKKILLEIERDFIGFKMEVSFLYEPVYCAFSHKRVQKCVWLEVVLKIKTQKSFATVNQCKSTWLFQFFQCINNNNTNNNIFIYCIL